MPYKRNFRGRRKYNKFQKKAYRRRRNRYKNRQQKLSIKTVKSIAKNVCKKEPEVKLKTFVNYDGTNDYNVLINEPTSQHKLIKCLLDTGDVLMGTDEGKRIGNQVRFKGIKLNMVIRNPRITNTSLTSTLGSMSNYVEVHVRVIGMKNNSQSNAPEPPQVQDDIPKNLFTNQRDLNMLSKRINYTSVYHKVIKFRAKCITTASSGDTQPIQPISYVLKKYIKIDKKITFTDDADDGDWNKNYFLWVYAYNVNHGLNGGTVWGNDVDYSPHINYSWTSYYTDS